MRNKTSETAVTKVPDNISKLNAEIAEGKAKLGYVPRSSNQRRLNREIEYLKRDIQDAQEELKHNPYTEDHPQIKKDLAILQADLAEAQKDLVAENRCARMRRGLAI